MKALEWEPRGCGMRGGSRCEGATAGGGAVVLVYYFFADDWGYFEREEGEVGDLFVPGGRGVVGGEVLDWK